MTMPTSPASDWEQLDVRVELHDAFVVLKRFVLSTLDAHEVYAKVGFVPFPDPQRLMALGVEDGSGPGD